MNLRHPSHQLLALLPLVAILGPQGAVSAERVMLTMADPFSLTCVNPARPSLGEGAPGGLDEGLIGDTDRVLLGDHDVGKQYYGANDSATITFRATGPVTVELGLLLSQWGSRTGEALVDGVKVREFVARAKPERTAVERFEIAGTGQLQTLTIRPTAEVGNYVYLDAVALTAGSKVEILNPAGQLALLPSAAISPAEAQALENAMAPQANLAVAGPKLEYHVTEEFASGIDGSRTYAGLAALDGDPARDYWAGGTAAPHALVLTWKEPVTITHNRVRWLGKNRGLWYGLEAWADGRWRLLYEERRNVQPEPVYRFPGVTTDRVRFTVYSLLGEQRMLMRAFELFNLGPGGEAR